MIPAFLLQKEVPQKQHTIKRGNLSFIDRTVISISKFILITYFQNYYSSKTGILQKNDARLNLVFLLTSIVYINATHLISKQLVLILFFLILSIGSGIKIISFYKRILLLSFIFGFIIFSPAMLNLVTPGSNLLPLLSIEKKITFGIYTIPEQISITREGFDFVMLLTLRVLNSLTIVFLILYTTSFIQIIRALSFFKIPGIFILTITLTYKFIFILSQTLIESYKVFKMRWWNRGKLFDAENRIAGRIGFIFQKSMVTYHQTYNAMICRGFSGKIKFRYSHKFSSANFYFILSILILYTFIYFSRF